MNGIASGHEVAWLDETSYWTPTWLVPSAWHEHAPFAFWLVNSLRPRSIVELGTHNGFSFFVFCEALKRLGIDSTANALDTWQGDEHAGFYAETVYESVKRISEHEYPDIAVLKRGHFDDFVQETPDGSVDLLHIDGRHRVEDVWHDFRSWLPKLSDRGVVIFHDTTERKKDFGVWEFWAEVSQQYPSFEFQHGHGLGVLVVGAEPAAEILAFVMAANENPEIVRETYHRLGMRVRAIAMAERELAAATAQRDRLTSSGAQLADEVERLKQDNEGLRREVSDLKASNSWRLTAPLRAVSARVKAARNR